MLKKFFLFLFAAVLCAGFSVRSITAQEMDFSQSLILQASILPEVKLGYSQSFKFPFLQGESPLTQGNNIRLSWTAEVSPISLNGLFSAVWTPIAFLELTLGGRLGSGWNINLNGDINGIGINRDAGGGIAENAGSAFDGLIWQLKAGGTFQFDFAAIVPGDWNHVVFLTYHEINYNGYTKAGKNDSWYLENNDGENMNGFNYYGNFVLGYQMPLFLDLVGFMAEMDLFLYDAVQGSQWGGDKIRWILSGILNFTINEQWGITLITQARTRRNYVEGKQPDLKKYYYQTLTYKSQYFEFYRVAAVVTFKF